MGNFGVAEEELGNSFPTQDGKVRTEILLWWYSRNDVATGAPLCREQAPTMLNLRSRRRPQLGDVAQQLGIGQFIEHILGHSVQIFVRPFVAWHPGVRQISLWISQPTDQPVRIHLASYFRKFGSDVTPDQFGL